MQRLPDQPSKSKYDIKVAHSKHIPVAFSMSSPSIWKLFISWYSSLYESLIKSSYNTLVGSEYPINIAYETFQTTVLILKLHIGVTTYFKYASQSTVMLNGARVWLCHGGTNLRQLQHGLQYFIEVEMYYLHLVIESLFDYPNPHVMAHREKKCTHFFLN